MIELPPSKSIGSRFLVATFFNGKLPADPIFEENEDLMVLQEALLEVYSDEEPIDFGDSIIEVGASGTALRFMTAVCASSPGANYIISGTDRLMARPMTPLINLLKEAGAEIVALGAQNTGPFKVTGNSLKGGKFSVDGNVSSQFISAAMLVAPYWKEGLNLHINPPVVSRPYIEMTAKLMERFGAKVKMQDTDIEILPSAYNVDEDFHVEADWSAASFFYEGAALGAKGIEIAGLFRPEESLQGDSVCDQIFNLIGVESSFSAQAVTLNDSGDLPQKIEKSFKDCPDLVLPFAVSCLLKGVNFKITAIAHLRDKESDRIQALTDEALKLGFKLDSANDYLEWRGGTVTPMEDAVIDSHDDHRIAMAFAMTALKFGKIRIENPRVVEKSFIDFWNQIRKIGLECVEENNVMTISFNTPE